MWWYGCFSTLLVHTGQSVTYWLRGKHYSDVIMGTMASQTTSRTIVYSTVYSSRSSKETSMLRVTGLCAGNSPVTGEFPVQWANNAENVSVWWRHHESKKTGFRLVDSGAVSQSEAMFKKSSLTNIDLTWISLCNRGPRSCKLLQELFINRARENQTSQSMSAINSVPPSPSV